MSHIKLKIKLFFLVTGVYAVIALVSWIVLKWLTPPQYFGWYPAISIFYLVMGLILTYLLDRARKTYPDKLLNVFMLTKTVKFFLTILFLFLYVFYHPADKMQFSISLMCNYIIYSFLEMYIYFLYNKKITQSKNGNVAKK